jgi:hypothetical protein
MLRPGDRVLINGTGEEAYVHQVHTHEVIVRVIRPGGHDVRSYAHESLRFTPALETASLLYAR